VGEIQADSLIRERFANGHLDGENNPHMKDGETREPWMDLCEQAVVEQDSEKLLLLAQEIVRLLNEKEDRLKNLRSKANDPKTPRSDSQAA